MPNLQTPRCFSPLGRQVTRQNERGVGNWISLRSPGCDDSVGHEVAHSLGIHHEQMHADRDECGC